MQVISLSVDGIQQAASRGLFDWIAKQSADVICLQDLRANEDQLRSDVFFPEGYHAYFCDTADGRNGVALYTRHLPRAIITGLGYSEEVDLEGYYIRADYEQFSVVSVYLPYASMDPQSLEGRMRFMEQLHGHLQKISGKRRKYIFCGNWQIAHQKADVQNWESYMAHPGFLPHERQWLNEVYNDLGYVDVMRALSSDRDLYSWWPKGAVGEGDGWRVDLQIASSELVSYAFRAWFNTDARFSSHVPLIVDYDCDLV